MYTRLIPDPTY